MSHGQSTDNTGFSVNNKWKLRTCQKGRIVQCTEDYSWSHLISLRPCQLTNLKATSYIICWSLTEVSFLSRSAEELSVPEKIAKTKGNNG